MQYTFWQQRREALDSEIRKVLQEISREEGGVDGVGDIAKVLAAYAELGALLKRFTGEY